MPPSNRLLIFALLASMSLAALHFLALAFYLYWTFWWFDILTHFTGGLFIGFITLWLRIRLHMAHSPLPLLLVMAFAVGIGWEIFEYFFGLYSKNNYFADTAIDIAMAFIGAYAAYVLAIRLQMYSVLKSRDEL